MNDHAAPGADHASGLARVEAAVDQSREAAAANPRREAALEPEVLFAAIRATRAPMVVSDPRQPDNPIIFANRAFLDLSGYPAEEVIGRNCRFLQGPGTDPADVSAIREAIAERRDITRDILNYRRDGTGFVNELHISPIFDEAGELIYVFGSQTDLGHYRKDWSRLQESEERYRSLFEAIDSGFCVLEMRYDGDGRAADYRFLEVNPAFERQTGLSNPVGCWMRELVPSHEAHWFETYGEVDQQRRSTRFENEAKALGRHYEVHAYPVGRPEDHKVAVLFTDITARKRAEADLHALNDSLEQQVVERTRELLKADEALRQSQKMEAIGQLTGGVAHDFNNLLTIIRSAAEFLRRPEISPERRQRYVAAIAETSERAAHLTGQLLAFARRQPLKAEVIDACEQVSAVAELVRPMIGASIDLRVDVGQGGCTALADPHQFDTALVNLAVNARDAMNGQGTLRISVRPSEGMPAIRRHPVRPGRHVAVEICDTGSGIPPENLQHIFEPFFTTKGVGKGTGLGLSQVYGFVKQSGGDIDVRSSPDGTLFTLYLPAGEPQDRADSAEPSADAQPFKADACILVVEDNVEVGRFSTELLHDLGFRTTWVADAAAALEKLRGNLDGFDLVFSDVMMPGMDGVALAREIKQLKPSLPVVLATGYSSVLAEEGSHGLPLVRKPYSVETLSKVLVQALQNAAA